MGDKSDDKEPKASNKYDPKWMQHVAKLVVPIVAAGVFLVVDWSNREKYEKHIGVMIPQYNLESVHSQILQVPHVWGEKSAYDTCITDKEKKNKCSKSNSRTCLSETIEKVATDVYYADHKYAPAQVYKHSMGCYGKQTDGLFNVEHLSDTTELVDKYYEDLRDTAPLLFNLSDTKLNESIGTMNSVEITEPAMAFILQNLQSSPRGVNSNLKDSSYCNCIDDLGSAVLEDKNVDSAALLKAQIKAQLEAWNLTLPPKRNPGSVEDEDAYWAIMGENRLRVLQVAKLFAVAMPSQDISQYLSELEATITVNASGVAHWNPNERQKLQEGNRYTLMFTENTVDMYLKALDPYIKQVLPTNVFAAASQQSGTSLNDLHAFCTRFSTPTYTVEYEGRLNAHYFFFTGLFLTAISLFVNLSFYNLYKFTGHTPEELKRSFVGDDNYFQDGEPRENYTQVKHMQKEEKKATFGPAVVISLELTAWVLFFLTVPKDGQHFDYSGFNVYNVWLWLNVVLWIAVAAHAAYAGYFSATKESKQPIHECYLRYPWLRSVAQDAPLVAGVFGLSVALFAQAGLQDSNTLILISLLFAGSALLQHFSNMLADAVQPYENMLILGFIDDDVRLTGRKPYEKPVNKVIDDDSLWVAKFNAPAKQIGFSSYAPQLNVNMLTTATNDKQPLLPTPVIEKPPYALNVEYHKLLRHVISVRLLIAAIIITVVVLSLSFIKNTTVENVGYSMLSAQTLVFAIGTLVVLGGFDLYYEISNSGVGDVRRAYMKLSEDDKRGSNEDIRLFLKHTYRENKPAFQAVLLALYIIILTLCRSYSRMRAEQFALS